jgi:type IV pilus assembly protein PilX
MKELRIIKDEGGSVLIIALIMLVLLTLLGISATSTSNIEMQIASNERNYKRAFYAANAAIEDARATLMVDMVKYNASRLTAGDDPQWDYVLNGSLGTSVPAATATTYAGGAVLFNNKAFSAQGNYPYTVTVWNNNDAAEVASGGDATHDKDSRVWAQADVEGPGNIRVSIKVLLVGTATGEAITGYAAQAGSGSGKSYSSEDLNAVASAEMDAATDIKTF